MTGLTLRQATAKLEKAIEPIFKYSSVEMHITNRFFSVLGSGKSVFIAMPQEKINIFKALAMAGDIGIYGDRKKGETSKRNRQRLDGEDIRHQKC